MPALYAKYFDLINPLPGLLHITGNHYSTSSTVHGPWGLRSYTDVRRVLVPVLSAVAGFQQEVDDVIIGDPALGDPALWKNQSLALMVYLGMVLQDGCGFMGF